MEHETMFLQLIHKSRDMSISNIQDKWESGVRKRTYEVIEIPSIIGKTEDKLASEVDDEYVIVGGVCVSEFNGSFD